MQYNFCLIHNVTKQKIIVIGNYLTLVCYNNNTHIGIYVYLLFRLFVPTLTQSSSERMSEVGFGVDGGLASGMSGKVHVLKQSLKINVFLDIFLLKRVFCC